MGGRSHVGPANLSRNVSGTFFAYNVMVEDFTRGVFLEEFSGHFSHRNEEIKSGSIRGFEKGLADRGGWRRDSTPFFLLPL